MCAGILRARGAVGEGEQDCGGEFGVGVGAEKRYEAWGSAQERGVCEVAEVGEALWVGAEGVGESHHLIMPQRARLSVVDSKNFVDFLLEWNTLNFSCVIHNERARQAP